VGATSTRFPSGETALIETAHGSRRVPAASGSVVHAVADGGEEPDGGADGAGGGSWLLPPTHPQARIAAARRRAISREGRDHASHCKPRCLLPHASLTRLSWLRWAYPGR